MASLQRRLFEGMGKSSLRCAITSFSWPDRYYLFSSDLSANMKIEWIADIAVITRFPSILLIFMLADIFG
jgi:hypothetical protein